jgi:hypothetical protein
MKNYLGDIYPGGGRISTFMATMPGSYDQQEFSNNDQQPPTAGVSNLKTANIFLVLVSIIGIMVLMNAS